MKLDLYPHNRKAFLKAKEMLDTKGRAAVIHPTGTGKSYIAFALAEENQDLHILWLAPNEYIFSLQTKILLEEQHIRFSNITFMTYPWLALNRETLPEVTPDIIILDEFHRAGAKQWGNGVCELLKLFPQAKVLGLSATNIRYLDGQRDMAAELFDGLIASRMSLCEAMAKGILPTPRYVVSIYRYEEKLSYFENRINGMKNEEKKKLGRKTIEMLRRKLSEADGISSVFEKHITEKNGKYIVFCKGLTHMYEMMSLATEWFEKIDRAPHIYSINTYNNKAEDEIRDFLEDESGHLKILYCIDMLNEGIHIGGISGVVLLRPTVSPTLYKQQIGRGLSAGSRNIPVIFDLVNNFDSLYGIEAIKEEWEEERIAYLRQCHDEQEEIRFEITDELADARELIELLTKNIEVPWETYCRELEKYTEKYGKAWVHRSYRTKGGLLLGRWVTRQRGLYERGRLTQNQINMLESAGMIWTRKKEDGFKRWYELLCEYRREHGTCIVPGNYVTKTGEKLGLWVANQRTYHNQGKMSEERKETLEAIGFCWDVKKAMWEEGFLHAERYYMENGNLDISCKYVCEDGYRLGSWVKCQRDILNRNKEGEYLDRRRKLDQIGMDWEGRAVEDWFGRGLRSFKKYCKKYGSPLVPVKYVDERDFHLGVWVAKQRKRYADGIMTEKEFKALEALGFMFEKKDPWMNRYKQAKAYYEEHGNLLMGKKKLVGENLNLYSWLQRQRIQYDMEGHGYLTPEKVRLLEEINISIRIFAEARWDTGYKALKKYYEEHGDTIVPYNYKLENGYELGRWTKHQREKNREGKLTKEEIKSLEELDMAWGDMNHVKAELFWNEMYDEAQRYYEMNGDLKVPCRYITEKGLKLGQWISQQRRIYRGELKHSIQYTEDRIKKMEKIGMYWLETR